MNCDIDFVPLISFGCFVCVISFQESLFKTFWAFAFLLPSVACFAIYFSHEKPTRMLDRLCHQAAQKFFSELSGQFSGSMCLQHSLYNIFLLRDAGQILIFWKDMFTTFNIWIFVLTKNTFHKTSYSDERCLSYIHTLYFDENVWLRPPSPGRTSSHRSSRPKLC